MSMARGPWPGRFVWHDLVTADGARAADFYRALLDWRIEEKAMPGCTYRMVVAGPGPIGGIVEQKQIPVSHWLPYLAVDDVDATAAKAKDHGGSLAFPPTDIPGTGRFAVVRDPQGAHFAIYRGLPEAQGADPDEPVPGRICWNELLTGDDAAALRFYSALFGWRDEPKDMGPMGTYHVQTLGGKQVGGIMKNPENGAPSAWLAYFFAEDLAASTQRAAALGARVLMANQPIPAVGAFSLLGDPVGAVFALFQPLPGSAPC